MRELLAKRVMGRYLIIPKLLGAFFILISALMLVYASFDAVTAWDRIQDVRGCVASAVSTEDVAAYSTCVLKGVSAGVYVYEPDPKRPYSSSVPTEEVWAVLMPKVANWLFWVVVLIVSILVYQWGRLIIPVEEQITSVVEEVNVQEQKKEEAKKTRKRASRKTRAKKSKK